MSSIPVLFIDASTAFRHLVARVLERHFAADITLVAEGDTWPLDELPAIRPQAVLLGLGAAGLVELHLLSSIQSALPDVPVIVLGHLDDPAYCAAALAAGAAAFVSKDALGVELIPALHRLISS